MNIYTLYLKSHTDEPDWEGEVEAETDKEAIIKFDNILHGEVDSKEIALNMEVSSGCCGAPLLMGGLCSDCKEWTR